MSVVNSVQNFFASLPLLARLLSAVGLFAILRPFYRLFQVLLDCYVLSGIPLYTFGPDVRNPDNASWAVITGATDGIGLEFAKQLGKKGFNLILVSRNPTKLQQTQADITAAAKPGPHIRTVAIDFSKAEDKDYQRLQEAVEGVKLSILVNNVGLSHDKPVLFSETPIAELEGIETINVKATLRVTRTVLPLLTSDPKRKTLVLNVGSFAGSIPTPLLTTYTGTKAFLIGFNRALNEEVKRVNCTSLLLNTYFVQTSMSKIRSSSWAVPSPAQYVSLVLKKLGRPGSAYQEDRKGREMTIWPQHALTEWAVREFVGVGRATGMGWNAQNSIRKRALRKEERANKAQ